MRIVKVLQLALVGAVGLSLYPIAHADNCSGRWSNVTVSAETIEVAKGHNVTYFHARGSATSDNYAFNGVGMCGGYALAMPDGKLRVVGVCARKTKDGDSYLARNEGFGGSREEREYSQGKPILDGGSPLRQTERPKLVCGEVIATSCPGAAQWVQNMSKDISVFSIVEPDRTHK